MKKQHILDELRRTAAANGGNALGRERFATETGIKPHHLMKYWARYGDALIDAGLTPNALQAPFAENDVVCRVVELARELGRFPRWGDFRVKRTNDATFPTHGVFNRFPTAEWLQKATSYCAAHPAYADVLPICEAAAAVPGRKPPKEPVEAGDTDGFVYLMKSGKLYKVGRTNHVGRRERELAIQLPEQASTVHYIRTDDPEGIEAYWHRRFADKRKNGEWFDLSQKDVAAFRRRKFM